MYNADLTRGRIKQLCKDEGISIDELQRRCNLGASAIRQINNTKGISSFSLARIADELHCSVDYLLGRTEIKEAPAEAGAKEQLLIQYFNRLGPQNQEILETLLQSLLAQQETDM